jgi:hypothetical protein
LGKRGRTGGRYFWFQVTLLSGATSWNCITPERVFLRTALWIWKLLDWIFYDLLVKPLLITWPRGTAMASFFMKTWTFTVVEKPQETPAFQKP